MSPMGRCRGQQVRQLFQDQQHPNGSQQSADDTVGKEIGQRTTSQRAEATCKSSQNDRQQERLEATKTFNLREHNGGQTSGGPDTLTWEPLMR